VAASTRRFFHVLALGILIFLWMGGVASALRDAISQRAVASRGLPLVFEANRGQTDPRVRFLSEGRGSTLFLTSTEAVLALEGGAAVRLRWLGAAAAKLAGEAESPAKVNYLTGSDPAGWRTGIPTYSRVRYRGIYPGIDLVFYGNGRRLEHDFELAAGADPRDIRLGVTGAGGLAIDAAGDLVLSVSGAEVRLRRPVSYQEVDGVRSEVASAWRLLPGGEAGERRAGFTVAAYDRSKPLVIDPVLVYSTYLGGSATYDSAFGIAVDAAGNTYVAGGAVSLDFPYTQDVQPPVRGGTYVAKLSPDGALLFATHVGGTGAAYAIALDSAGNIYLTGFAGDGFPLVHPLPPEFRQVDPFTSLSFVAKLDPAGSSLIYSTTLGGLGQNEGRGIAVDAQGSAYVVGGTRSGIPAVNPPFPPSSSGGFYLAKLAPSGSSVIFSTVLQGYAWSVATDPAGFVYLTGDAGEQMPMTPNAFQPSPVGGGDAFVAKLQPSGQPVYFSYFGGTRWDDAQSITADAGGNAYLTGVTDSQDFPVRNPIQADLKLSYDIFVSKLSPSGGLVYSTYLGGTAADVGMGIGVDRMGNALVTGWTISLDFPLRDPIQSECGPGDGYSCYPDAFVTEIGPRGDQILFSTYLGGTDGYEEEGFGIAADSGGNIHVAGVTFNSDFPTVHALQPELGGGSDGFVVKISPPNRPPVCAAAAASPATVWPPNGKLVPVGVGGVTDADGDPVTIALTAITQDEPLSRAGTPDASGLGTSSAWLRADRLSAGDGRVYRLSFTAADTRGGTCTGIAAVCVPHDQGQGASCVDGEARVDSTGAAH
jgi:hypothetical protein